MPNDFFLIALNVMCKNSFDVKNSFHIFKYVLNVVFIIFQCEYSRICLVWLYWCCLNGHAMLCCLSM